MVLHGISGGCRPCKHHEQRASWQMTLFRKWCSTLESDIRDPWRGYHPTLFTFFYKLIEFLNFERCCSPVRPVVLGLVWLSGSSQVGEISVIVCVLAGGPQERPSTWRAAWPSHLNRWPPTGNNQTHCLGTATWAISLAAQPYREHPGAQIHKVLSSVPYFLPLQLMIIMSQISRFVSNILINRLPSLHLIARFLSE